jgi:hypothetical protein
MHVAKPQKQKNLDSKRRITTKIILIVTEELQNQQNFKRTTKVEELQ